MALGDYSNFVIRDEYFQQGFIESLNQNLALFNEASQGAIRLLSRDMQGHYAKDRFFDLPTGIVSHRDITSAAATTDSPLTQGEMVSVKVNRKIGPFAQTEDAFFKIGASPEEMSMLLGEKVAEQVQQDYVNAAINAVEAALSQHASITHDYSATGDLDHAQLITGLSKFGDQASKIKVWVQHSKPFFDLMAANVTVASGNIANMTLVNGTVASINRPLLVTDSSYLLISGAPDKYPTLGLVDGAVTITESERPRIYVERVLGVENIYLRYQGELAFNVSVKGHKWDVANGGLNPADATLGTATNWDLEVASLKDGPGIYVLTQ